jgi:hypothetical protein
VIPLAKLKDYIDSDLITIFCMDEFAEEHTINGRKLPIILDNDRLMKRSKLEYDGITVGDILYFVRTSDYGVPPKPDEVQSFNNILCTVFDVRTDSGIYEVILKKNVS